MSRKNLKFWLLSLMVAAAIPACGDDDKDNNQNNGAETTLQGSISENLTLDADKEYTLTGQVKVLDGATLTIPAGTVIKASTSTLTWLQIDRGGKIIAEGTAAKPIVFTSANPQPQPSDWGGIIIFGKAPNNVGADAEFEGGFGVYGGNVANDNSGILKYVRIEYAGRVFFEDAELNGLTLASVGNGTTIEYVQVYKGSDDGFEWFGGTVNAKYLVATNVGDDCFDTDEGYNGTISFAVCTSDDNGIEASNNADTLDAAPVSKPTYRNVTLIGCDVGLELKDGFAGVIEDSLVYGCNNGFNLDDTIAYSDAVTYPTIKNTIFFSNAFEGANTAVDQISDNQESDGQPAFNEITFVADQALGNIFNLDPEFTDLDNNNFIPTGDVGGRGAFIDTTNWLTGWTKFTDAVSIGDEIVLQGNISANLSLSADQSYVLFGQVKVLDGVTLTIPAGTTIKASTGTLSWLQIDRGGKIIAEGTAAKPIVFTSANPQPQPSDWGGIIIFGKAPNNVGADAEFEGGFGVYGGNVANDNSGILKYVRIEYAGRVFFEDAELNGLTLASVGNGTTIEYVQVYKGSDDGIEWFGGTVNAKYLLVTDTGDDCFDTDEGYNGNISFAACINASDNGIEASSNGDTLDAAPISKPMYSHVTVLGCDVGLEFKDGFAGSISDSIIQGCKNSFNLDDTIAYGVEVTYPEITTTAFFGNITADANTAAAQIKVDNEEPAFDELAFVSAAERNNSFDVNPQFDAKFVAANPALTGKGAFAEGTWADGWTK